MRCAVLGSPIAHSLSPVLHRTAYDELGLEDWRYDRHEVSEVLLPTFLDGLDASWRGLSLTMPLKRAVVPLLDALVGRAEQARAANTVVFEDGRRTGHNTDVPGVAAALRERYDGPVTRALVVGGGATAASAVLGLADLGCQEVDLLVRDPSRATETVATVARHPAAPRVRVLAWDDALGGGPGAAGGVGAGSGRGRVDVLVSTVPVAAQRPAVTALAATPSVVFEVVYDPWPTPLADAAASAGAVLVSGLDLLVHQAALQVELMTGTPGPLAAMRRAGEHALAARSAG